MEIPALMFVSTENILKDMYVETLCHVYNTIDIIHSIGRIDLITRCNPIVIDCIVTIDMNTCDNKDSYNEYNIFC